MARCFVIQPFDGGKFDKRYDDVFAPAIASAGLEPYRIDRDPSVAVPIDEIHAGIAGASACLADITTDNSNVWFELGVAIATQRPVVIVCAKDRPSRFPFDVQHLSIITYETDSSSDFERLREAIETRLKARLARDQELGRAAQLAPTARVEGLEPHEIAALVAIAQEVDAPDDHVSAYTVRQGMENAGFTKLATTLATRSLLAKGMIQAAKDSDYNGSDFFVYRVAESGMRWLFENQRTLPLTATKREGTGPPTDDDIPF